MNIKKNISGIEYTSIGLSVLGSIAAVVTQQVAYVATPLTLSLSLSLINRQKELVKSNHRLAKLEQQLLTLPAAPTTIDFHRLSANVRADAQELKRIGTVLTEIENRDRDISPFLTEIDLTKDSLKQLSLNFSNLEKEFNNRQDASNITSIDRGSEEIRTIAQVTSSNVVVAANFLEYSSNLSGLELDTTPIYLSIEQMKLKLTGLELDRSNIYSSIEDAQLRIQLLEDRNMGAELVERISDLDSSLSDLHDYNLRLTNRIDNYSQERSDEIINAVVSDRKIEQLIQHQLESSSQKQLDLIRQILPTTYSYTLISGRTESRKIFLDALSQAQARLILVCPWLTKHAIDKDTLDLMIAALSRGVRIDIGWGHLSDVENSKLPLSKERLLNSPRARGWGGYSAVNQVYDLQSRYENLLNLKILGTHEKFLVCDRQFAMLGSHNYMTSNTSSSEREVGIKTDSPELIDKLTKLFDRTEA